MRRSYAAAVALPALLALVACGGGGTDPKPGPSGGPALPMVALDPCPRPGIGGDEKGGKRLPDVILDCVGGGEADRVRMSSLGGKPYVVNLWASWCLPCREEMPEFQKVYVSLKDRVGFLGVDTKDFERPAREAIQRAAVSYPSVFDSDERIKRSVNSRSLPATIFLRADGTIANVHVGQLTEAELRAAIAKHLGVS